MRNTKAVFLVAVVVAFLAGALLSGCGGGGATTESTAPGPNAPTGASTSTATQTSVVGIQPIELPAKFEVDKTTPLYFREALEKKQPIVVFLYNQGDTVSENLREVLRELSSDPRYQNVIFLAIDASRSDLVYGLAEPLGANYTPFIAVLDAEGVIRSEYPGYVDRKLLEQAIYDVAVSQGQ